ncbi:Hsp33 family molecular chaperone [Hoeflea sp. TYP-13]|uniref:Hsp33 family molecular chaperone n=1 Tax=Hoeflea sp. TYP-13 TaxID=3230023 RepID=UPI0034C6434F
MTDNITLGEIGFAGDDKVVPFQVEGLDARGRAVQLGPMLNAILDRHDYPEPVARLLAETITLTVLLGTSLKFTGKFIVQTQTEGPVDMLVADFTTPDSLRAYARYDEKALAEAVALDQLEPHELLGKGILAFTIDQGAHMQRYQGIVELNGSTLEEIARAYFRQSEQIPTEVRLAAAQLYGSNSGGEREHQWRAGGVVLQFLPESPERMRRADLPGGDLPDDIDHGDFEEDEDWIEAKLLMETIADDELADPQVGSERLLYRLFHERGVRVFEPLEVRDNCSCSRDKIKDVLMGLESDEIAESVENGEITVKCEFCSSSYVFDPSEIEE